MKVLICGKGGSGKSTISVLIAKNLKTMGYKVLLVDADESNFGLYGLLGIPPSATLIENLGGKKGAKKKLVALFSNGKSPALLTDDQKWKIRDIPDESVTDANGIKLLVIGKIHNFGEGCACAMGFVSKTFLSNLDIGDDEMVIVDTEAGIEHFGRRVEEGCDMILGIADPSYESFMLVKRIEEMGKKAGVPVSFILNKVDEAVEGAMSKHINMEKVIARIPKDNSVFMDSLEGRELKTNIPEIGHICKFIEDIKKK